MESLVQKPIGIKSYYALFRQRIKEKKDSVDNKIEELNGHVSVLFDEVKHRVDYYKNCYNIDITIDYLSGNININKVINILTRCKTEQNEELSIIVRLFKKVEELYYLNKRSNFYNRIIDMSLKEYTEYVKFYYTEVQKTLILKGYAYKISPVIGTICIQRVRNESNGQCLDFAATRRKKEEILARGGRIYDKKEEEWCKERGLEYIYEDHKVYKRQEYLYIYPILYTKLNRSNNYKFVPADYRHRNVRGKTNEDLLEMCNRDKNKILELEVDMKTKLNLCLEVDKSLYNTFIRNENQTSITYKSFNS